jgi:hypothetical protein
MLRISPIFFVAGVTFQGFCEHEMHGVIGKIFRLLVLALFSPPPPTSYSWPFSFVSCSFKHTDCRCVRTFPASDVHILFLIAGRDILLAAEINYCGYEGFGLSVAS